MDDPRATRITRAITRLYRLLLVFYPASFRRSFCAEMVEVFQKRCEDALSIGMLRLFHVATAGIFDLCSTAFAERFEMLAGPFHFRLSAGAVVLDMKYAFRTLLKKPGFLALVLVTLTLSIGGTTAIFSVVNAVLLRPLPFHDPERLVTLWELLPQGTSFGASASIGVAPLNYFDWKRQNHVFAEMALIGAATPHYKSASGAEQLQAERVSEQFFDVLGVRPRIGRSFKAEDFLADAPPIALVSHEFWIQHLGRSDDLLNRTLKLDDQIVTVVGVMPSELRLPSLWGRTNDKPDVWIPLRFTKQELASRRYYGFRPVARLKPGVTLQRADAEMSIIAERLSTEYPETNAGMGIGIVPLKEQLLQEVRPTLFLLFGATMLVQLIACVNVANLLLVRMAARRSEIAVRAALGASQASITRQLLIESLMLVFAGGLFGLAVARWTIPAVISLIPQENLMPRLNEVSVDFRVLVFTFAASGLIALTFGIAAAIHASRTNLNDALREGGRSAGVSKRRHRLASALVISEVALALVLLLGAGVLLQSFRRLDRVDPGFRTGRLLTLQIPIPQYKYRTEGSRIQLYRDLLQRARALPGVEAASLTTEFPDAYIEDCLVEGHIPESRSRIPQAVFRAISPAMFETLQMPVLRGRPFDESDTGGRPPVAIISERMARNFWPGENPLGRRFRTGLDSPDEWRTVVGIVGDIQRKTADRPLPEYYVPYMQVAPWNAMKLLVRTQGEPLLMAPFIRNAIRSYDSDVAVRDVETVERLLDQEGWKHRIAALLMAAFAGTALLLAAAGIYGVMSNVVSQRSSEMGLRITLGARPAAVQWMVIRDGMKLATCGAAIGLILALALARVLRPFLFTVDPDNFDRLAVARQIYQSSGLLFGISASDPITWAMVSVVLLGFALVACYIPAQRATRAQSLIGLRSE
jgi:putative ABC transport system permease protein